MLNAGAQVFFFLDLRVSTFSVQRSALSAEGLALGGELLA